MKRTHALLKTASWLVWLGAGVFVHESSLDYPMPTMQVGELEYRVSELSSRAYSLPSSLTKQHYQVASTATFELSGSSSIIPDPFTTQNFKFLSPAQTGEDMSWVYFAGVRDLSLITADAGSKTVPATTIVVDSKFLERLNQEHKKAPFHQYKYSSKGKNFPKYHIPLSKRGGPLPVDATGKELLDPTHTQNSLAELDAIIKQYEQELVIRLEQQKFKAGKWVTSVNRRFPLRTSFKKHSINPIYLSGVFSSKTSTKTSLSLPKLNYVQLLAVLEYNNPFAHNAVASHQAREQEVTAEYATLHLSAGETEQTAAPVVHAVGSNFDANPRRKLTSVQLSSSKLKEAEAKATASTSNSYTINPHGCNLVNKDQKETTKEQKASNSASSKTANSKTSSTSTSKANAKTNSALTPCEREKLAKADKSAYPYLFTVIKDYNPDANDVLARITAQIEEQERKLAAQNPSAPDAVNEPNHGGNGTKPIGQGSKKADPEAKTASSNEGEQGLVTPATPAEQAKGMTQAEIETALAHKESLESLAAKLTAQEFGELLKRIKVLENRHYVIASTARKLTVSAYQPPHDAEEVPARPPEEDDLDLAVETMILGYNPNPSFPSKEVTLPPNLHQAHLLQADLSALRNGELAPSKQHQELAPRVTQEQEVASGSAPEQTDKVARSTEQGTQSAKASTKTEVAKSKDLAPASGQKTEAEAVASVPAPPVQASHENYGVKPGETKAVTKSSQVAVEETSRLAAQSYHQLHYGHNHYPGDGHDHDEEIKPVTEIKTLDSKKSISRYEEKSRQPDVVVNKGTPYINTNPSALIWKKDSTKANTNPDSAKKDDDKDIKKILSTGVVSIDKIKALEPGKAIVLDQNKKINSCVAYQEFYENVNKLFSSNKIQSKLPTSLDKYESFAINDRIKKYVYSLDDNTKLNLYQENDECLVRILAYTLFETDRSKLQIQETPANKKRYATVSAMVTGAAYPSQSSSILTAYILKSRDLFVTSGSEVYELYGYEYQVEIYPSYMSLMITNKAGLIAEEQTSISQ